MVALANDLGNRGDGPVSKFFCSLCFLGFDPSPPEGMSRGVLSFGGSLGERGRVRPARE